MEGEGGGTGAHTETQADIKQALTLKFPVDNQALKVNINSNYLADLRTNTKT